MPDGRVAFIDFGMTKRVAREDIDAEVGALRAAMDGDAVELHRRLAGMGFFDPADEQVTPEAVFDHFHDVTGWYIEDREVTVDRALVTQTLIDFGDPRSRHWQLMRRETMPPQAMLARRMEALTLGVLGQLGATANWHRIAREWLFGDPPSTELGALEEPFHTRAAA
jgi:predicted unusual protein kinase regulating ubiquinone biosynthesis (AarF/ABC1/UbiB family)